MATRPSPEETANTIIDALVTDLHLLPGHAVPIQTLKACLLARGAHVEDLEAGLDYAGNTRDWIEDGPSRGSVRLTASGLAAASQPTALAYPVTTPVPPPAPSTAKPPGSQKRRLWKWLVGAVGTTALAILIAVSTILGGVIPTLEYFHIEWPRRQERRQATSSSVSQPTPTAQAQTPPAPAASQTNNNPDNRDPDSFYQLGKIVATVSGAQPDMPNSRIIFAKILETENANPSRDFEYRNWLLRCVDGGRNLPSPEPPPGVVAAHIIGPAAFGWSCSIVGQRK